MKRNLLLSLFFVLSGLLFANDFFFRVVDGKLKLPTDNPAEIVLKEEIISIVLKNDFYEVTVVNTFYNSGEQKKITVGFPILENDTRKNKMYDFKCKTNENDTDYAIMPIECDSTFYNSYQLEKAYTRDTTFCKKSTTKIKIMYKVKYDSNDFNASFFYGTNFHRNKDSSKIVVNFENNLRFGYPQTISMGGKSVLKRFKRVNGELFEATFKNIDSINLTDVITIKIDSIYHEGPKKFPLNFPYIKKIISEDDLYWIRTENLVDIKDAIYALHGADFAAVEKKAYFDEWGKRWYQPYKVNPNFSEDDFSSIEKENLELINKELKKRKYEGVTQL